MSPPVGDAGQSLPLLGEPDVRTQANHGAATAAMAANNSQNRGLAREIRAGEKKGENHG
ncbi:MAG: hypothetical protein JRJ12_07740 [Deltaproteobacteria bacterium]|nr:hypothetical protein [Deltaproteobacteria bacterium]MBW2070348.1 hypothetical protein [Deltaproteobacteria bacterium]